jgi:Flp pilus assembly protein TadG
MIKNQMGGGKVMSRLLKSERGQSLVEFALVVPILLTILCGVIDFGWLYVNKYQIDNATYSGVRYAVIHGTDVEEKDKKTLIEGIKTEVKNNLSTRAGEPEITVTINDDDIKVNVKCKIKMLTFVGQTFVGKDYDADATSIGAGAK